MFSNYDIGTQWIGLLIQTDVGPTHTTIDFKPEFK